MNGHDTEAGAALALAFALAMGGPPEPASAPPDIKAWASPVPMPAGAERYSGTRRTQSIYILDGKDVVERVKFTGKWAVPGGMEGHDAYGVKYRTLAGGKPKHFLQDLKVKNSLGSWQANRSIQRDYPDGTRFDELLFHGEKLFEHRTRVKEKGRWKSSVSFQDEKARPPGYSGLKQTCASCHEQAGTGQYDRGLVPGGDTVISDPLDWSVAGKILLDRGKSLDVVEVARSAPTPIPAQPQRLPPPMFAVTAPPLFAPSRGRAACST